MSRRLNRQLLDAVFSNDVARATELLAQGADPNAIFDGMYSPLHMAAQFGKSAMVELLCKHNANVNMMAPRLLNRTPLHACVFSSNPAVVRCLISHKADINLKDANGDTPLDLLLADGGCEEQNEIEAAHILSSQGAMTRFSVPRVVRYYAQPSTDSSRPR